MERVWQTLMIVVDLYGMALMYKASDCVLSLHDHVQGLSPLCLYPGGRCSMDSVWGTSFPCEQTHTFEIFFF